MIRSHKYFLGIYYRFNDIIALNVAFFIATSIRFKNEVSYGFLEDNYLALLIFINLSWILLSQSQKIYGSLLFYGRKRYFLRVALVILFHLLVTIAFNGLVKTFYSRLVLMYTFIGFGGLMFVARAIINMIYKSYLSRQNEKNLILIVGDGFSIQDVETFLTENSIDEGCQKIIKIEDADNLVADLERLKEDSPISEVYIKISLINDELMDELTNYCDNNFIRLRLVLDWQRLSSKMIESRNLSHTTVISIPLTPLDDPYNTLLKRSFDILFSVFIIATVFSWLFPIMALIIKLTSKGPVFFKQKRTGVDNKEFNCWKFRSMRLNEDSDRIQATKNDDRITSFGKFIRSTSLDEFPQFLNVFRGDMSVVGPRPHMLKHTEEYSQLIGNFMNRHAIKPGITGLAQIKGYRGEIDDSHMLTNRVRLDRFYVNNWSLYLDLKIVFFTIFGVFQDHK
ncbi:MAG: exopolysaccharide biosynthesis polyprenyl glycosylphosphotransferase [Flavobacteriales bacterium]|nr:exopolysaccharide biosynthesis polyprenyl glycosylphosphotransferase [Flavobacteriales bacterium]